MKRGLNISNRILYTFISVMVILIIGVGVFAFGTLTPSTFGHSAGELDLSAGVNGNAVFNGNVGIGTSNPQARLHVQGIARTDGMMFPDGTLQTTAAGPRELWTSSGGDVYYNNGNVGIGVLNPSARLDIAGNIKIDGIIFDGVNFPTVKYLNRGEDVYWPWAIRGVTLNDTCNNRWNEEYTCPANEEKKCQDISGYGPGFSGLLFEDYRDVECYVVGILAVG